MSPRSSISCTGWAGTSSRFPPDYAALASLIDDVVRALTAIEASSGDQRLSQALGLLEKVSSLYKAIKTLGAAPDGVDAAAFLAEVPERLFELLLVDYLAAALHPVHDLLMTLGVIRSVAQTSGAGRPPYLRRQLDFDRLRDVIADQTSIPRFVYGWGEDDFDTLTLFGHLREVLEHTGALVSFGQASTSLAEGYMGSGAPRSSLNLTVLQTVVADQPVELAFMLLGLPAEDDQKPGLILQPVVPGALGVSWGITDALSLRIRPAADPSTLFGIVIRPGDSLSAILSARGAARLSSGSVSRSTISPPPPPCCSEMRPRRDCRCREQPYPSTSTPTPRGWS